MNHRKLVKHPLVTLTWKVSRHPAVSLASTAPSICHLLCSRTTHPFRTWATPCALFQHSLFWSPAAILPFHLTPAMRPSLVRLSSVISILGSNVAKSLFHHLFPVQKGHQLLPCLMRDTFRAGPCYWGTYKKRTQCTNPHEDQNACCLFCFWCTVTFWWSMPLPARPQRSHQ